jgi:hypothetical protein
MNVAAIVERKSRRRVRVFPRKTEVKDMADTPQATICIVIRRAGEHIPSRRAPFIHLVQDEHPISRIRKQDLPGSIENSVPVTGHEHEVILRRHCVKVTQEKIL